jgi:multicomponent Na+:H+ antiporter subunit C
MEIILAIMIGGLYSAAVYMLLRRSMVKILIGIVLLSQATNMLIFTSAGLTRGNSPVIKAGETTLANPYADPLPQALVLTAIVISFGLTAFALALTYRTYKTVGTDDLDQMRSAGLGGEENA